MHPSNISSSLMKETASLSSQAERGICFWLFSTRKSRYFAALGTGDSLFDPPAGRRSWFRSPRQLASCLAITVLALPCIGWAQQPMLIPQPRELESKPGNFKVTPDLEIILLPDAPAEDHYAAQSLVNELKSVTQKDFAIISSAPPSNLSTIVLGRLEQPSMQKLLGARGINTDGVGEQGYVLDVTPSQVLVAGKDGSGLFYGVQTLRQLTVGEAQQAQILAVQIRDWPVLPYRGTQVDMARGPVPNLDYLKRIVRTIAEFKLNQLYFYMEDSFPLNGQPLVGVLSDTLSRDEWKELVAYAAPFHIDIIPAQNSCGHLHKVLRFERYAGLAETAHGHVLAPQESGYTFIQSMYEQMVPVFSTSFYNVGCDETWDLGRGKSAARAKQIGLGKLYIENLLRVHDIVHAYNKQVIFWGDIALEYPDLIKTLPKDMLVATWEYFVHPNYDKWLKPYVDAGTKIIVCPWVGNTNLIMPDYEQAAYNIGHFVSEGKKAGAIGMDNTVWNDDGETLYGLNWWSIVYGAAAAWEPGIPDVAALDQKYDWAFYRNTDHRFVEAIKQLSHINETLRKTDLGQVYGENYGGTGNRLFWHGPFSPQGQADTMRALPAAPQVRHMAEEAYSVFAGSAGRARRNADTLPYLEFATLKLDALGMRYIYLEEMAKAYANSLAHQSDRDRRLTEMELSEITSTNGHLQDLRDYTTKLRELYRQLWLSENLATWLPNVLQLYDLQSGLWQDKIAQFQQVGADFRRKKPLPPAESLGLISAPATK
jgi:hypothetical protein